ncbi:MAG: glycosyltransferase family 4 protein [Bryobacteraceae bacterium]|nr:glycosyltransferase family 4 protein [Bryobacteraceae bacterium]
MAIDGTPLAGPGGGIRRYVVELHAALQREFPEDEYVLVSDQLGDRPTGLSRHWWLYGLNQRLAGFDLFHGTDFSVPYLKQRPAVLTIHDLSPWRFGQASDRVRRRVPWLVRLKRYTLILTPSEAIRREVIAHFGVSDEDVVAVPLAASNLFRPVAGDRENYFLCVGTLEPRKNLTTLYDAIRLLRQTHPQAELHLVGRPLHPPADSEGIRYLGEVHDEDLPALYSHAAAVCYPSLYEGFGLPVLEALQCGATVITSRDPALVETGGDATRQVDALDAAAWARAMSEAAPNPRALARAAEFSWSRTARLTREVYQRAVGK